MSDLSQYGDAHNPGDPSVLDRMVEACRAGAPLGIYLDDNITTGHFALYEPTEHLPWIICIRPVTLQDWLLRFPHAHPVTMLTETADEAVERLTAEGVKVRKAGA